MLPGFSSKIMQERNKRLLNLVLFFAVVLLGFFAYEWQYFYSFFSGSHAVSSTELTSFAKASDAKNIFVLVQPGETRDTGLQDTTTNDEHEKVTVASFYTTVIGGKTLLVRGPIGLEYGVSGVSLSDAMSGTAFTLSRSLEGMLRPLNGDAKEVIRRYTDRPDNSTTDFLPYYLDMQDYKSFGYISLAIAGVVLLLAVWLLFLYMQRTSNPAKHPYNKRLAAYGPVDVLTQQIDEEMAGPHTTISQRFYKVEISDHWVVGNQLLLPMQIDRIVWVHRRIVKRKMYFVVTVGKNHFVDVYDDLGHKLMVTMKPEKLTELFDVLRQRAPQAVFGYSKELEKLWNGLKKPEKANFPGRVQMLPAQTLGEKTQNQMTR
ncbi:DUF6709 family protein [Granulicella mallensis]|uniref:Uncharacterized protein n=1 Tax=Granulicella mallensis (strain ATCC BAA-1857 / DSM 23137 / MP5ACTX8) TaxID=682795 RepID=G8P1H8_GRAMM|nr:DUF6709 family protein [Granulicella mallensis]AEU34717.1 hypothetical protein AciX8_0362 [Granulicella mallensis MP5ACTX8]